MGTTPSASRGKGDPVDEASGGAAEASIAPLFARLGDGNAPFGPAGARAAPDIRLRATAAAAAAAPNVVLTPRFMRHSSSRDRSMARRTAVLLRGSAEPIWRNHARNRTERAADCGRICCQNAPARPTGFAGRLAVCRHGGRPSMRRERHGVGLTVPGPPSLTDTRQRTAPAARPGGGSWSAEVRGADPTKPQKGPAVLRAATPTLRDGGWSERKRERNSGPLLGFATG